MNQRRIITEFDSLSLREKGALLDELWGRYQQEEQQTELSEVELGELDRRMADYEADPTSATDVDVVHARLLASLSDA
jgi:putative addiction module component (TIGR02574 family)